MALVRKITPRTKERHRRHEETECFISDFADKEGKYLQLETTGTKAREVRDTVSQIIQFDEQAASELKELIEKTFPNLK
jgi:ribosomal protein L17